MTLLKLPTPTEFDFAPNLAYLTRSSDECLYRVDHGILYKVLRYNEQLYLLSIEETETGLQLTLDDNAPANINDYAISYVETWFDLRTDLTNFYHIAEQDDVLYSIVKRFFGLRLMGIPSLFEALSWAIIGQQINLPFAYQVKRRFVETFGEALYVQGKAHWAFPTPQRVASLSVPDLRALQFSNRKAEYVIGLAQEINEGRISKQALLDLGDYEAILARLQQLRGIGRWTAHYALMRCFQNRRAFPIDDVGLHNAIKTVYQLDSKPTIEDIRTLFEPWTGWEAYATFYLWRALM